MADPEDLSPAEVEALLDDSHVSRPSSKGGDEEPVRSLDPGDVSRLGERSRSRLEEVLSTVLSREVRVGYHDGNLLEGSRKDPKAFEGEWFRVVLRAEDETPHSVLYGVPAGEARVLADIMMGRDGTHPPDRIDDVSRKGLHELFQTARAGTASMYAGLYGGDPGFGPPAGEIVPGDRLLDELEGQRRLIQRYTYGIPETISRGRLVVCRVLPEDPPSDLPGDSELFQRLFDATPDLVFVVNPEDNRFVAVNRTACQRFGYERSRMLSMRVEEVDRWNLSEERWDRVVRAARSGGESEFQIELDTGTDEPGQFEVKLRYEEDFKQPLLVGIGRRLGPRGTQDQDEDVSRGGADLVLPEGSMSHFLRRALRQRMRGESRFALMGLRHRVTVSPGEEQRGRDPGGNPVRRILAERVLSHLRPWDILVRGGADELLVLVRNLHSPDDALTVANRLKSVHLEPVRLGDQRLQTEGRIGVVMDSPDRSRPSDYLRAAERVLERSTENGERFDIRVDPSVREGETPGG